MDKTLTISKPLSTRAGCHASLGFNYAAPDCAEVIIDYSHEGELLARECRPIAMGAMAINIKTHPEASHIACLLRVEGRVIRGLRFKVDCGAPIQPTLQNFIVIGAMKAGTTSLFKLLAQHPAFCRTWAYVPNVSFTKEVNYFSHLYRKSHTPVHYDWRFPFEPHKHAWTLDVSPNYAKWPASKDVPARIASLGGGAKLAYILREPVDRIESHFAHKISRGHKLGSTNHYVRTSLYAMQIDNFCKHIELNNILLLDFEQLRRRPALVLSQIYEFLGVEPFSIRNEVHNTRVMRFQLNASQRTEFADAVRPDVERLITHYRFKPAEKWLRRSASSWLGSQAFRR